MRRPLTTNGVPLVQTTQGVSYDTIFDVNDLDPDYVYAVTLFAWTGVSAGNVISVGLVTDGVNVPLGIWNGTNIDAYRANGNGAVKVLDRVPMRGNQQLGVAMFTDGGDGTAWFGYFERVGAAPVPVPIRPLQPGELVSPFNAAPTAIISPADGSTLTATIHALDTAEEKLDFFTLYIACSAPAALVGSPSCTLKVPGGVDMVIPIEVGVVGSPLKVYEGVPVRQPATGDNLFTLEVVGDSGVSSQIITTVAYGRFARA